jgi:membrane fusion protein (multidrug efflux system)
MSDKFEEVVTNWRLMIPIILTTAGLIIAIKFGIEYSLLTWDHITTEDAQVKGTKIHVSPEVSGQLRALYVDEGATVKRGELLAELDPIPYQSEVAQASAMLEGVAHQVEAAQHDLALAAEKYRGELAQAQALLARRRGEMQEAETALAFERARVQHLIVERRAAVEAARAREVESRALLEKTHKEWQRAQELFAAGVIAHDRLDAAQTASTQASARHQEVSQHVRQAEAHLDVAKASEKLVHMRQQRVHALAAEVRKEEAAVQLAWANLAAVALKEEQINRLKAQRRALEARLNAAQMQLSRTRIFSPLDGIIILKKTAVGEWLERGQPLLVLTDPHDLWVQTNIRESEIADVQVGSRVRIWVDAYPEQRFEGVVASVGAAALSELVDAKPPEIFSKIEQRIPVKVALQDHNGILKPGMMVWVGIERQRARALRTSPPP